MVSKLLNFWTTGTIIFLKGPNHKHLTSADPLQSGGAGAEIAFQPLGVVAGLRFAAVVVELLGADLTAATAVQDEPDSRGALGLLLGAAALGGAGERLDGEHTRVSLGAASRRGAQRRDGGLGSHPAGPSQTGLRRPGGPRHLLRGDLKKELPRNAPPHPELFSF